MAFLRALLLTLVVVSSTAWADTAIAPTPKVIFLAHSNKNEADDNPTAAIAVTFQKRLAELSGGNLRVEIFPENQLGSDAKTLNLVHKGVIQMSISSVSGMSKVCPILGVLDFPFAFHRLEDTYPVFDGDFGAQLRQIFAAKAGVDVLGFGDTGGFFQLTNSKHPIRSPADMVGLRIRTIPLESHKVIIRSLGGEAVGISWGQLPNALQGGVVDGQMNPVSIIRYARLDLVQKYLTMTNHLYVPFLLLANQDFLAGLTPDERIQVETAARDAILASRTMAKASRSQEADLGAALPSMIVYRPTADEIAQFRSITQAAARENIEKSFGAEGTDLLDAYLKAIQAVETANPDSAPKTAARPKK